MNSIKSRLALSSRSPSPAAGSPASRCHPLDAVPLPLPGVETKKGVDGGLHLLRRLPPRNRLDACVRALFRSPAEAHLDIDLRGAQFWELADGSRSLRDIAARLAKAFGVAEEEARDAVMLFTGVLMQRHFLAVAVAGEDVSTAPPKSKNRP